MARPRVSAGSRAGRDYWPIRESIKEIARPINQAVLLRASSRPFQAQLMKYNIGRATRNISEDHVEFCATSLPTGNSSSITYFLLRSSLAFARINCACTLRRDLGSPGDRYVTLKRADLVTNWLRLHSRRPRHPSIRASAKIFDERVGGCEISQQYAARTCAPRFPEPGFSEKTVGRDLAA